MLAVATFEKQREKSLFVRMRPAMPHLCVLDLRDGDTRPSVCSQQRAAEIFSLHASGSLELLDCQASHLFEKFTSPFYTFVLTSGWFLTRPAGRVSLSCAESCQRNRIALTQGDQRLCPISGVAWHHSHCLSESW